MRIDSAVHVKGKGKLHGAQATSDARIIPAYRLVRGWECHFWEFARSRP